MRIDILFLALFIPIILAALLLYSCQNEGKDYTENITPAQKCADLWEKQPAVHAAIKAAVRIDGKYYECDFSEMKP